ncbi:MAG: ATP-dependent helicase HrpB [Pseudoclavibacter sp.]|nr:ATP-dependent helicase HrpB [Pseudoclavibacter sp.]
MVAASALGDARFDLRAVSAGLSAAELLRTLPAALERSRTAIVSAPPGTGKTTIVPPLLAELCGAGRVLVSQPRRIAARAAAARLARLTGGRLGGLVGYSLRGERSVSPGTRVEFLTEGLLVRRLLADPGLDGVSAIVLDEVHERSLDGDLAFAMARDLAELREELRLVAMSATLDAERWAGLLGGLPTPSGQPGSSAPVVRVRARTHPVEAVWAPPPARVERIDARGATQGFLRHVARTVLEAARRQSGGALVFLPGAREIDAVVRLLREAGPVDAAGTPLEALPLHGRLPAAAQEAALREEGPPRIVVASEVAESSITVPGVRLVVDAGLSREPRRDIARGASRLVTLPVSRDSAEQRAGRAGRLGPGRVVRCYAPEDWARMRVERTAQIAVDELDGAMLTLACWGAPGGAGLALPEAPPAAASTAAQETLRAIGAVDEAGRATARGRALAEVPAGPRLARALLDAGGRSARERRRVAEAVAVLASGERAPGGDALALWQRLRSDRSAAGRRWREDAERFEHIAARGGDAGMRIRVPGDEAGVLALVAALARPERIARRRGGRDPEAYLLASGTGARLPPGSSLAGQEWIVAIELAAGAEASVLLRSAVPLPLGEPGPSGAPELACAAARALLAERTVCEWNGRRVAARSIRALGAIELSSRPVPAPPRAARASVAALLRERGLRLLAWPEEAGVLRRRLALLHRALGDPWPDVSTRALLASAEHWLGPELDRIAAGEQPGGIAAGEPLRRLLPWPQAARLEELAPERLPVPSGSRVRLGYPDPDDPDGRVVLAVKLQECFGLLRAPRIADGRVPVQLHLLSPAGRPLAVTEDLPFFWREVYPSVRAENRGRYAKHPWPEDPLTAQPRRGTKRSGA